MTDEFILCSDPEALKREGIPMHPATAKRLAKRGLWPAVQKLSAHKSGWWRSQLVQFKEKMNEAA